MLLSILILRSIFYLKSSGENGLWIIFIVVSMNLSRISSVIL